MIKLIKHQKSDNDIQLTLPEDVQKSKAVDRSLANEAVRVRPSSGVLFLYPRVSCNTCVATIQLVHPGSITAVFTVSARWCSLMTTCRYFASLSNVYLSPQFRAVRGEISRDTVRQIRRINKVGANICICRRYRRGGTITDNDD